ncbi:peptidoglycan-binding domain 1 protein [Streptomyces viridochromogenes DSM 40736]|uniref:Peptidoglycan-binding domain 1 protein n=1 Tax=Streptomyces viridochromogenes (strain DSM 40736 / JCM 4977 / BCRC 1201 / Tue 494) TaxID=591159 RepID=D9X1Q6_STRVT|nr:glycoside hydrolase domain-containing protein [Streptomyces viridochromogenes]EFL35715.1 peptidoglycan-binding domain 1 protein [Streptomyces viridochromogenes DSM 40736]
MAGHRLSKKGRYIAWATAGAVVVAGAGIAAQTSMAATAWPAQKTFTGRAFDTCTAPSLAAMKAWKTDGFYGGAAVYIGGKNRGCAQPNLTASWVKSVNSLGWKLIPLYVGAQPPCQTGGNPEKFTASTAASLGARNATDAVAKASALGMKAGSPIYLDMEPYDIADKACNDAVLTYVRSFTKTLRAKTYRAGYYGFSSSSAKAIATAANKTDLPGNLWYALWDKQATTTKDWPWDPKLFTDHSRGHQYMVNSKETRSGHTITVDRNAWDAPVAIIG